MPTIWLIILYFIVKSNYWKKFFLYLGFVILLITSLPIVPTFVGKFFYNDNYRVSNHDKKPAYVLIPTAGIWYDGYNKYHPTYVSIIRTKYGKELSEQFTTPLHHRRTILALETQNFEVLIPDNYIKNTFSSNSIIPSTGGVNSFNEIIYEFLGVVWYYFMGKFL